MSPLAKTFALWPGLAAAKSNKDRPKKKSQNASGLELRLPKLLITMDSHPGPAGSAATSFAASPRPRWARLPTAPSRIALTEVPTTVLSDSDWRLSMGA